MKTFKVNITETYARTIEVEAEDQYDAYDKIDVLKMTEKLIFIVMVDIMITKEN